MAGKTFPAFPAHAQPPNFTYLVRSPYTELDKRVSKSPASTATTIIWYIMIITAVISHFTWISPTILVTLSIGQCHYNAVIMSAMAFQITSLTIGCTTVNSGADQRKHQNSALLAFVREIHRGPVNSPHKWPVTRKNASIWWRHHV